MSNNEQREAKASPNIYQRLHAIMADVHGVEKTSWNNHSNYKFAGHEAVTAALRGAYVAHRVHRSATIVGRDRVDGVLRLDVLVRWTNIDDPQDFFEVTLFGESPPTTKSGQATAQQVGIAFSYAVKNAEFKVFSLTGDGTPDADDDDAAPRREGKGGRRRATPEQSPQQTIDVSEFLASFLRCTDRKEFDSLCDSVRAKYRQISDHDRKLLTTAKTQAETRIAELDRYAEETR